MPRPPASNAPLLDRVVTDYQRNPSVAHKARIGPLTTALGPTDWLTGPGDDAAAIPFDEGLLLAAGEAMWPAFVQRDPYGAGIGAVVANVNDIAAMGGRCLGIVDTVVGPEELVAEALRGLAEAAERYAVPLLGGHLSVAEDPGSLSAFAVGRARTVLASRNARPGHVLLFAGCLDGEVRSDFPFLPTFRSRGSRLPGDVAVLAELADAGDCVAAKDVSMAGLLGSLAMLLEPSDCGVVLDLDVLPRPSGIDLVHWLRVFPSYGFLLCAPEGRVRATVRRFEERELVCVPVGFLDGTGSLRVRSGAVERHVTHVSGVTGLGSRSTNPGRDRSPSAGG